MKRFVHVIPHVHWDREWYFSAEESRVYLVHDMEEILQVLENDPDYPHFLLDGQTVLLEDYSGRQAGKPGADSPAGGTGQADHRPLVYPDR